MVIRIDYKNLELILVNDGSTDNSLELVEDFLKRSPKLKDYKIISNIQNSGISASKNIGMRNVSGKFLSGKVRK